jgi:hypothetical protein
MKTNLKCFCLGAILVASSIVTYSQSASAWSKSIHEFNADLGAAPNNLWFGGQASYRAIGGGGDVSDNIMPSVKGFYEFGSVAIGRDKSRHIVFPTVFNIGLLRTLTGEFDDEGEAVEASLQEIAFSSQGLFLGINPYLELSKSTSNSIGLTIHGLVAGKINAFRDSTENTVEYLPQVRLALGLDVTLGQDYPATVSITPTITRFKEETYLKLFDQRKSSMFNVECSVILPIKAGLGASIDMAFGNEASSGFKFGIIISQ